MVYIITIIGAMVAVALGNFLYDGVFTFLAFGEMLLWSFLGVVAVIAMDGIWPLSFGGCPRGGLLYMNLKNCA